MYLDGLDEADRRIVLLLTENARMSYSDIGKQVGLSRVAVKFRIRALEERGIIEGYTTIIDPQKISGAVSCYFEIETAPETFDKVIDILSEDADVTQIYRVTGRCRLHVHAVTPSAEAMDRFISETIDKLPGVKDSNCNIIISRIKDIKGLRL